MLPLPTPLSHSFAFLITMAQVMRERERSLLLALVALLLALQPKGKRRSESGPPVQRQAPAPMRHHAWRHGLCCLGGPMANASPPASQQQATSLWAKVCATLRFAKRKHQRSRGKTLPCWLQVRRWTVNTTHHQPPRGEGRKLSSRLCPLSSSHVRKKRANRMGDGLVLFSLDFFY